MYQPQPCGQFTQLRFANSINGGEMYFQPDQGRKGQYKIPEGALVENENFLERGYRFVAAFDSDPKKIGSVLPCGLVIQPVSSLKELTQELGIEVGVITTPPAEAQHVADVLFDAGIKAILNFSPIQVRQPEGRLVENVDFTVKIDDLAYHLSKIG